MRASLGLAFVCLLVAAACSSGGSDPVGVSAPAARAEADRAWRHAGLKPVSQVVEATEGVVVYYGVTGDQVRLQALDATSGKALWQRRVESDLTSYFPEVADDHVALVGPHDPSGRSRVLVVDAETGDVVSRSRPVLNADLSGCGDDDDASLCVESGDWSDDRVFHLLEIPGAELRKAPAGTRSGMPESTQLSEQGWSVISSIQEPGEDVWQAGLWRESATAPYRRTDLAIASVRSDGSIRWLRTGRQWCNQTLADPDGSSDVALACNFTSGRIARPHFQERFAAEFALEGIDLDSGRPVWREPMGPTETPEVSVPTDARGRIAVQHGGRTKLITPSTGSAEKVAEPLLWSTTKNLMVGNSVVWRSGVYRAEVEGRAPETLPWPLPGDVGLQLDALTVVPHPNAVVAYQRAE